MEKDIFNREMDEILIKCLEGSASEKECQVAWEWIQANSENKKHYEEMREIWLKISVSYSIDKNDTDTFWLKMKNRIDVKSDAPEIKEISKPNHILKRFIKIAAIFVIAFGMGAVADKFFTEKNIAEPKNEYYSIEAPRGAKSFVTLADGTKIWLNAGSKISYQRSYNQHNRDIYLEGEAFFEVAKNKNIPFLVHSAGIVVKATGTAFNVKAYPEEGIVETTLVEGSVSIESIAKSGKKEHTLMQPNQKANFYKVTNEIVVEPGNKKEEKAPVAINAKIERIEVSKEIDPELYTSWKDKRWIFEKQKFEDIAIILERLYDVKIIFKDEQLKNYRLSGSLQEENLEQVLKAIQFTIPLDFSITHNEVVFSINNKLKNKYQKILKMNND